MENRMLKRIFLLFITNLSVQHNIFEIQTQVNLLNPNAIDHMWEIYKSIK